MMEDELPDAFGRLHLATGGWPQRCAMLTRRDDQAQLAQLTPSAQELSCGGPSQHNGRVSSSFSARFDGSGRNIFGGTSAEVTRPHDMSGNASAHMHTWKRPGKQEAERPGLNEGWSKHLLSQPWQA